MTTEDVAHMFEGPHREGKGYRARCPVHKSRGATLGIYPKEDKSIIVCYGGCKSDDVLEAVGLTFKDLYYQQRSSTPETRKRQAMMVQLEVRERRLGLMDFLVALEPENRKRWIAEMWRCGQEIIYLRRMLYPEQRLPIRFRGTRLEKA